MGAGHGHANGSHGYERNLRVLHDQPGSDSELLVWNSIQGKIFALGLVRRQLYAWRRRHIRASWHSRWSSLLLCHDEVSCRSGRDTRPNASNLVQLFPQQSTDRIRATKQTHHKTYRPDSHNR